RVCPGARRRHGRDYYWSPATWRESLPDESARTRFPVRPASRKLGGRSDRCNPWGWEHSAGRAAWRGGSWSQSGSSWSRSTGGAGPNSERKQEVDKSFGGGLRLVIG